MVRDADGKGRDGKDAMRKDAMEAGYHLKVRWKDAMTVNDFQPEVSISAVKQGVLEGKSDWRPSKDHSFKDVIDINERSAAVRKDTAIWPLLSRIPSDCLATTLSGGLASSKFGGPSDRETHASFVIFGDCDGPGGTAGHRPVGERSPCGMSTTMPDCELPRRAAAGGVENCSVGTLVGRIERGRPGQWRIRRIRFTLLPDPQSSAWSDFRVDSQSGSIRTNQLLDRERQQDYQLRIRVVDNPNGGSLQQNSVTATVTVRVLDINDNTPEIRFPRPGNRTFRVSWREAASQPVLQVLALVGDSNKELFDIDPDNGKIRANAATAAAKGSGGGVDKTEATARRMCLAEASMAFPGRRQKVLRRGGHIPGGCSGGGLRSSHVAFFWLLLCGGGPSGHGVAIFAELLGPIRGHKLAQQQPEKHRNEGGGGGAENQTGRRLGQTPASPELPWLRPYSSRSPSSPPPGSSAYQEALANRRGAPPYNDLDLGHQQGWRALSTGRRLVSASTQQQQQQQQHSSKSRLRIPLPLALSPAGGHPAPTACPGSARRICRIISCRQPSSPRSIDSKAPCDRTLKHQGKLYSIPKASL
uniref:CA domain-containing protein n=1 Tax=Macrostomum lignano TaxID=282301 RepID=A0A1I8FM69_9PLAT